VVVVPKRLLTYAAFVALEALLCLAAGLAVRAWLLPRIWEWFLPINANAMGLPVAVLMNGLPSLLAGVAASRWLGSHPLRNALVMGIGAYLLLTIVGWSRVHGGGIWTPHGVVYPHLWTVFVDNVRLAVSWVIVMVAVTAVGLWLGRRGRQNDGQRGC
jgi:hypothetical protein